MTHALVDPHQSAFFAADPSVLQPPDPFDDQTAVVPKTYTPHKSERPALELAAAVLVIVGLVARHLAHRDPDPHPRDAARESWGRFTPTWLKLAVPAIRQAYVLGKVAGTPTELEAMATDYAVQLGEYINDSSADALARGVGEQLNAKWSERVAWQRAAAGYGLDSVGMHAHIASLMRGAEQGQTDVMPSVALMFVAKLLTRRADSIGANESWRAQQSGKVISWLYLQRAGRLPASARKKWATREDETTCPICGELDDQHVALDQPWVTTEGVRLWAPSAHPGCRCEVELVVPDADLDKIDLTSISKARGDDPYNRDLHGHFAHQESRQARQPRPQQRVLEREPELQAEPQAEANPFAPDTSNPFAPDNPFALSNPVATENPFAVATENPMAVATENPFAVATENPFAVATENPFAVETENPFVDQLDRARARFNKTRVYHHLINLPIKPGPDKFRRDDPDFWHMPHQHIADYFDTLFDGAIGAYSGTVDFDSVENFFDSKDEFESDDYGDREPVDLVAMKFPTAWDGLIERFEPFEKEDWTPIIHAAVPAWQYAITHAEEVLPQLEDSDFREIGMLMGYQQWVVDTPTSTAAIKSEAEHLRNLGFRRDGAINWDHNLEPDMPHSWCEAYADYVTYTKPYLLGEPGENYLGVANQVTFKMNPELAGTDSGAAEELLGHAMDPQRMFSFTDIHPSPRNNSRGHMIDAQHEYAIEDLTYRSAIADLGVNTPPSTIGMLQYMLGPYERDIKSGPVDVPPPPLVEDDPDYLDDGYGVGIDNDGDFIDPFDDVGGPQDEYGH